MNRVTKQFLSLILEEDEKPEKETAGQKGARQRQEKADKEAAKEVYKVETSSKLMQGRPISDPGLANMRYRSNAEPSEAKAMLEELGIKSGGGSSWHESLSSIMSDAASGEMSALIRGASVVQSPNKKPGVKIDLSDLWKQDDKDGKRSFGFIRAVIAAANKAGTLAGDSTVIKNLRVEEVVGENVFLVYVSNKKMSWGA